MMCPQCGGSLRKNGFKEINGNPVQQWRGHLKGCKARGRQPINSEAMSQTERSRKAYGRTPRQVRYALFRKDYPCLGHIHKEAFYKVVIGHSRKSVDAEYPEYWAIPWGSLSKKEKEFIELQEKER